MAEHRLPNIQNWPDLYSKDDDEAIHNFILHWQGTIPPFNYLPSKGACPDVITSANSLHMARSSCSNRGARKGIPYNMDVAGLVYEVYGGREARCFPIPGIRKQLTKDISTTIRVQGLLVIDRTPRILVLQSRKSWNRPERDYVFWGSLIKFGLSETDYAEYSLEFLDLSSPDAYGERVPRILQLRDDLLFSEKKTFSVIKRTLTAYKKAKEIAPPPPDQPSKRDIPDLPLFSSKKDKK